MRYREPLKNIIFSLLIIALAFSVLIPAAAKAASLSSEDRTETAAVETDQSEAASTESQAASQEEQKASADKQTVAPKEQSASREDQIPASENPSSSQEDQVPASEDQSASPKDQTSSPEETTSAAAESSGALLTAGLAVLPDSYKGGIPDILGDEVGEKNRYVAHTGLCGKAAQNSLLAFQLAADAGYWAIETDIRWTSDHVIICYHDESFSAHSDGTGMVEDRSWDYVSNVRVYAGNVEECGPQPVARFSEYLDICKASGRLALVDLKYCSTGYKSFLNKAYEMVADRDMVSRTIWQCSLGEYLTYIKSLDSNARCWLLCGEIVADDPDLIVHAKKDLHCEGINVPVIDKAVADQAHENGMICVFYETDKKHKQEKCFEYGYDLVMENGIETDE
ncbi:MAG: hypothetical protein IJJ25_13365 [Lachnospiraceae bacterium]|nr:hypothetical protein [Lachnospiraceae bacterium]